MSSVVGAASVLLPRMKQRLPLRTSALPLDIMAELFSNLLSGIRKRTLMTIMTVCTNLSRLFEFLCAVR